MGKGNTGKSETEAAISWLYRTAQTEFRPVRLREEAIKSWEYLISDKIVYFREDFEGDNGRDARLITPERYMNREVWFEVIFLDRASQFNVAVIEYAGDLEKIGKGFREGDTSNRDNAVFLGVVNGVEQPQQIRGVPSIVRLKTLHDFSRRFWNLPDPVLGRLGIPLASDAPNHRKRGVSGGSDVIDASQLPREMVETGTHVVDRIASNYSPFEGVTNLFPFDNPQGMPAFSLVVEMGAYVLRPFVGADELLQDLQVLVRPTQLLPWPFQRWHGLHSLTS